MKKIMKSTGLKTVMVKCSTFWDDTFEINPELFDDILMEAATRAVEKRKNAAGFKVAIMIECWEKRNEIDPNQHICYNTYFVLINAGLHRKAEMLRANFFKEHKIDIQKESLKPENTNGGSKNKPNIN